MKNLRLAHWVETPLPIAYTTENNEILVLPCLDTKLAKKVIGIVVEGYVFYKNTDDLNLPAHNGWLSIDRWLEGKSKETGLEFQVPTLNTLQELLPKTEEFNATVGVLLKNNVQADPLYSVPPLVATPCQGIKRYKNVVDPSTGVILPYNTDAKEYNLRPVIIGNPVTPLEDGVINWDNYKIEF